MSPVRWVALVTCVAAIAGPVAAQSILQFDQWMQKIDRHSQSIQRNVAARESVAALADAREVGDLYKQMADYFARRGDNTEDAVRLSKEGAVLAEAVVKSLQENDFAAASRSVTSITHACRDCHVRYKPLEP